MKGKVRMPCPKFNCLDKTGMSRGSSRKHGTIVFKKKVTVIYLSMVLLILLQDFYTQLSKMHDVIQLFLRGNIISEQLFTGMVKNRTGNVNISI